jgi:hypothetical protein
MDAIYFLSDQIRISFVRSVYRLEHWPVPRVGDWVQVKQGDKQLKGNVESVQWTYSDDCGPVVTVTLQTP